MLLRCRGTGVTADTRPATRSRPSVRHGCLSHVAGAAWPRQPCSMTWYGRCWS